MECRGSTRIAYSLRALGRADLPRSFDLDGVRWSHLKTIKHDFFAATGFYQATGGRMAVLKVGRTEPFAGVPLRWLGKWLCNREMRFYCAFQDIGNVPRLLGRVGTTGLVHEFVPGRPLSREHPIPDAFFDELFELIARIHTRGVAYVDTNKPQNILQGDDGKPYLIDFQISFDLCDFGNNFFTRAILRRLQKEDLYHILKHKRKLRPDLMTPEETTRAGKVSFWIKLHRIVTKPYFLLRRRTFKRLKETGRLAEEGSK